MRTGGASGAPQWKQRVAQCKMSPLTTGMKMSSESAQSRRREDNGYSQTALAMGVGQVLKVEVEVERRATASISYGASGTPPDPCIVLRTTAQSIRQGALAHSRILVPHERTKEGVEDK